MNTNCNRLDPHQGNTTKNYCAHACARECLTAVDRQPAPREAASKAGKSANHGAGKREKNLEGAIVTGAVLILMLVAVVYYLRFVAPGRANEGSSNLGIEMITHY